MFSFSFLLVYNLNFLGFLSWLSLIYVHFSPTKISVIFSSLALPLYLKNHLYWHFDSISVVWGSKFRCLGSVLHNYGILYSKAFLWWWVGLEDGEKILKCGRRKRRDDVHWVWGNCEKMREDAKIAKIHGESCWLHLWPLFRCLYFVRYFFKKSCLMTSRIASIFLLGYWVGDRGAISNSHLPQLRFTSWCLSALEDHLHVSSPGIATKTEKRPTQVLA